VFCTGAPRGPRHPIVVEKPEMASVRLAAMSFCAIIVLLCETLSGDESS